MDHIKGFIIAFFAALSGWLGVLFVPVILLVACNIIDYATGLLAIPYRPKESLSSYKSIRGIAKKICMWLLIIVGFALDTLLKYICDNMDINIHVSCLIACVVAVWLTLNEIISILENLTDIGVPMPAFIKKITKYMQTAVESKITVPDTESEDDSIEQ